MDITAGRGAVCTFTNRLDRPGRIRINAVSIGGVDTARYSVSPALVPKDVRRQSATTTRQVEPAAASGQPTDQLQFGRYVLQQSAAYADEGEVWSLIAVTCNGRVVPFEQGRVSVRISEDTPLQRCTFINLRQRQPGPPPPRPRRPRARA